MQKDLKIGMVFGGVLITAFLLWLSTRPCLSVKSRMLGRPPANSLQEPADKVLVNTPASEVINEIEPEKIKTQRFHIIRRGETLSEISGLYYDSAGKWQKILDANRDVIKDANKLKTGTKLIIPP